MLTRQIGGLDAAAFGQNKGREEAFICRAPATNQPPLLCIRCEWPYQGCAADERYELALAHWKNLLIGTSGEREGTFRALALGIFNHTHFRSISRVC